MIVAAGLVVASCGVPANVATERSDQITGGLSVDLGPKFDADDGSGTAPGDPANNETAAPPTSLEWGGCKSFDIPPVGYLGTAGWECATLAVPMDPLGGGGEEASELEPVELALTRHPATGERQGSLLLNPGGPGGSGLEVAWGLRSDFPANVLRAFDIVSWDPRGVGQSRPQSNAATTPISAVTS
jgi:pimeloyl-ACP methyl ester carboxylesterase